MEQKECFATKSAVLAVNKGTSEDTDNIVTAGACVKQ